MREELHGDVKPRKFNGILLLVEPEIHVATQTDKPFMLELAREKYAGRVVEDSIKWVEWCMGHPERLVLVGPNSFGIAQVDWIYGFERKAKLDLLAARAVPGTALEALRMVKIMIAWAKDRGCVGSFRLDADTGVDFTPFAKRLGGKVVTVSRCEIPYVGAS